jgi:aspartate racemase
MRTIGLLGGMSWESTVDYYRVINETVRDTLGGLHSAQIVLYSVDFQEIEECQASGDWAKSAQMLGRAARGLEAAGADFIGICTNTMHKVADSIASQVGIPLVHVADVTATALIEAGIGTVGLLGTRYTMEQDFYKERLIARGIQVVVPNQQQRDTVNTVIYEELCLGKVLADSKNQFRYIIDDLAANGAQAAILGCTEIGMLIRPSDTQLPLFDTTYLHARALAYKAMAA